MEERRFILDDISAKETELKESCDQVCLVAENLVHDARVRASAMLKEAEETGRREAASLVEEERKKLEIEITAIRKSGEDEIQAIRETGRQNLERVVEMIVRQVRG